MTKRTRTGTIAAQIGLLLLGPLAGCDEAEPDEPTVEARDDARKATQKPGDKQPTPAIEGKKLAKNIPDPDISLVVRDQLAKDDAVPLHRVDVATQGGVVTLGGSVTTLLAKERASERARAVRGVRSVVNQIDVLPVSRTDAIIAASAEAALKDAPAPDSEAVNVSARDGIVRLEGRAESWQEKHLAEEAVKSVAGVRGVDNAIELVIAETRPDAEIQADVKRRLETDAKVDSGLIGVAVDDGKVKLGGTVGSAAERWRAFNDAWVAGVSGVNTDALEVKWWARDELQRKTPIDVSAKEAEQAVRDALELDPRVLEAKLDVNVDAGTATLSGTVPSLEARMAAEEDAANTVGVWRVRNFISVRPKKAFPDSEVADRVRHAIAEDAVLERRDVAVSVINGKVELRGVVDSQLERAHADTIVSRVGGVVAVDNRLRVEQPVSEPKRDWEIAADIESALRWDPFVYGEGLEVDVEDGVATISGEVRSLFEYERAVEDAEEAGARRVISKIDVEYGPQQTRAKEPLAPASGER